MLNEDTVETLRHSLLSSPATRGLIRTDGRGTVTAVAGLAADEARVLAERVDLALAATRALGRGASMGAPNVLLIEYESAVLVAGVQPWGEHVIVIGAPGVNVGLLLSRLRRLLATDARERGNQ